MELTSSTKLILAVIILTLGTTTTKVTLAQTASCTQNLIPCANYLNGTQKPSTECCSSLKEAVENDRVCLCNLYNTPGLLASFGVNITQAFELAEECGASNDTSICNGLAPSPAVSPTTTPAGGGKNGTNKGIASSYWTWSLLLFVISFIFVF